MPPKVYQTFRFRGVGKVVIVSLAKRRIGRRVIEPAREVRSLGCRSRGRTSCCSSTDLDAGVGEERVVRHVEIARRRARGGRGRPCRIASRGSGRASRRNRPAKAVGGCSPDACRRRQDQPFGLGLAIVRRSPGASSGRLALRASGSSSAETGTARGFGDLLGRAAAHEQRMAAPGEHHLLARLDRREIDLDRGQRQHRAGRVHLVDEGPRGQRRRPPRPPRPSRYRGSRAVSVRPLSHRPRGITFFSGTRRSGTYRKTRRPRRYPARSTNRRVK